MVILHIDFSGPFNEEMLYHENLLTEYQQKDGHIVTMLTTCFKFNNEGIVCHESPIDKIMINGVRLIRMEYHHIICRFITGKIRKVDGVFNLLEQIKPEIIFFHSPQTLELLTVIEYLKFNKNVKLFIDNHADFTNSATNLISFLGLHKLFYKYLSQMAIPYTCKFYGITPARIDFLVNVYGIPREKVALLIPGADVDRIDNLRNAGMREAIRFHYGFTDNHLVIITGGKIDHSKTEVINLVKAVDNLNSDKVRLLIFGSVEDATFKVLNQYILNSKIVYLGWLTSQEIISHFLASDLAVFPGRHSVLWEQAVGAGLPCIFKFWKGFNHVDLGGNCIFLYENNECEIENILTKLINDPNSLTHMKNAAEVKGKGTFSCREIARYSIQF